MTPSSLRSGARQLADALHRYRLAALSAGVAAVTLAVACGSDPAAPAPSPDASTADGSTADASLEDATVPSDINAFCNGTLALYGPQYEACCDQSAAPKRYAFDSTLMKSLGLGCTTLLGKSIESGRASLSTAAAATCESSFSAALAARSCPQVLHGSNQPSASIFNGATGCADVLVGHQSADAPCANDYECAAGLTCVGWTPNSDGACKTPPGDGALCGYAIPDGGGFIELVRWGFGDHPRCAAGLYCDATAMQQGTCKARKAAEDSCSDDDECAEGLRCQGGACGTAAPGPIDAPCKRNSDCQDPLFCKSADGGSVCATPGTAGTSCSNEYGSECQGACVKPDGGAAACVAYCGAP